MGFKKYFNSLISSKKINRNISFFSFWDRNSFFSNRVMIGFFTRIHNSTIGDYTRIKPFCDIFNAQVGKYCSIAKGVKLGLGRHPLKFISTNSIFYKPGIRSDWFKKINFQEELNITIGNDVWIGLEAVILDGVKIGDGAVVAARSVVTKDVPPYCVVAGVPAKIIKYRFGEELISELLDFKWWNLDDNDIEMVIELFTDENFDVNTIRQFKRTLISKG